MSAKDIHPDDIKYYGRSITRGEIENTFNSFNNLPPREMRFCDRCGKEIKWYREQSQFSVRTGKQGHTYHLKCPLFGVAGWEWERENPDNAWAKGTAAFSDCVVYGVDMHYDSHLYKFIEDDREFFNNDEL